MILFLLDSAAQIKGMLFQERSDPFEAEATQIDPFEAEAAEPHRFGCERNQSDPFESEMAKEVAQMNPFEVKASQSFASTPSTTPRNSAAHETQATTLAETNLVDPFEAETAQSFVSTPSTPRSF